MSGLVGVSMATGARHQYAPGPSANVWSAMGDGTRRRMLAVAFGPPNMAEALRLLPRVVAEADCVELRLDLFAEGFDLPTLLRERHALPAVVTLRPPDQGGRSLLPAADRLKVLLE